MENKENLDEYRFQKARKKFLLLGIGGIILLMSGIGMIIGGFTTLSFGMLSEEGPTLSSGLLFGGTFISFIGSMMIMIGFGSAFARNIASYKTQTTLPVKTEALNKGSQMAAPGIKTIAKSIKEGVSEDFDLEKKLAKIQSMKEKGTITETEYQKMRNKILGI